MGGSGRGGLGEECRGTGEEDAIEMRHEPGSGWIIGLGDDFKSDGSRAESRGQIVESRIAVAQLAG